MCTITMFEKIRFQSRHLNEGPFLFAKIIQASKIDKKYIDLIKKKFEKIKKKKVYQN